MDYRDIPERIQEARLLDAPADALTTAVNRALPSETAKDLLRGKWLGHLLHPMLTDLPIGFWTSAWVLDVVGGRGGRDAARKLVAYGVLSALPTAATGLTDLSDFKKDDPKRRVGVVHATANTAALLAYAASWQARRRGQQWRGVAWGTVGAAAATIGGYLGGHLAFG